jgi:hypothetical protein
MAEHGSDVLCKTCHAKHYGPKGYGFAGGGAIMHTQAGQPTTTPSAPTTTMTTTTTACPKCNAVLAKPSKFCSECGAATN